MEEINGRDIGKRYNEGCGQGCRMGGMRQKIYNGGGC